MVTSDTIEGRINDIYSYHYDVFTDVLYIRSVASRGKMVIGEETDEGFIVFRDEEDKFAEITFVCWLKYCGRGNVDNLTLSSMTECIEKQAMPLLATQPINLH